MEQIPYVVNFLITSKCDHSCAYCYSPLPKLPDLDHQKIYTILKRLKTFKTRAVLLGGGEPTMHKDFVTIIKSAKSLGFKIYLDTNCDYFTKFKKTISNNITVLGIPIDYADNSYRSNQNQQTILKTLQFFKNKQPRPLIRVGTVVTKGNYMQLNDIGKLLANYSVDIWKIYEFIPHFGTRAYQNRNSLQIPHSMYEEAIQRINKPLSKELKIVKSSRNDRTRAYFMISPDGNVFIPKDNLRQSKNIIIGHVLDSNIVTKWRRHVCPSKYQNNINNTFAK